MLADQCILYTVQCTLITCINLWRILVIDPVKIKIWIVHYVYYNRSWFKLLLLDISHFAGSCNATSTCLTGICYRNSSGCPLSSPVSVATNYTLLPAGASPSPISDEVEWDFAALVPYMIAAGILAVVISVIATLTHLKMSRSVNWLKRNSWFVCS